MKIIKRNIVVMLILCISILMLFILYKNGQINFIEKIFNQNQRNINDGMSYQIYDNQQIDALKLLITIERENGIDTIKYYNKNGEERIINCNGKQIVAFDTKVSIETEYTFEIISSAAEITTEKLLLTNEEYQEYINSRMNITTEELEKTIKFSMIFNNINNETNYYKIGEMGEWKKYTGEIIINSENIDLNDISKGTNILPIYAKQVDVAGNILISERLGYEVTIPVKLDVFNDVIVQGKTLQQYGFTASWVNGQNAAFTIGDLRAGHWTERANWSGTFRINNLKTYGAKQLYVNFYHWKDEQHVNASKYPSTVYSTLTVVYADGTSTSKNNENITGNHPVTIDLEDKNISYIQMYLYGLDNDYTSSWARVDSIILKGIELPVTE